MKNSIVVYELKFTNKFNEDIKYYIKKKKFHKITTDIKPILDDLEQGIIKGDVIANLRLGEEDKVYKVRVANSDTHMGKSNGYRIIYYVQEHEKVIFIVSIYYKKDDRSILADKEIVRLVKEILEEG